MGADAHFRVYANIRALLRKINKTNNHKIYTTMCQIQKNLQVTMTADQVKECIDEMHDALTPAERMAMLEALYPNRSEIIELLRLNKETEENSHKTGTCPAYWSDGDLYKMIKIMFDPRGVMTKGQLAACVNEVIYNNY